MQSKKTSGRDWTDPVQTPDRLDGSPDRTMENTGRAKSLSRLTDWLSVMAEIWIAGMWQSAQIDNQYFLLDSIIYGSPNDTGENRCPFARISKALLHGGCCAVCIGHLGSSFDACHLDAPPICLFHFL